MQMAWRAAVLTVSLIAAVPTPAAEADKVELYRGMLAKRPENPLLFGRFVDAWLVHGEVAALQTYLEGKATAGGPLDWRLLAEFRNFSGDEAGALMALDEALKKDPSDPQTRLARAKALGAVARFEDALTDLAAAAKDPAARLDAQLLCCRFLARAGRPTDAVKAWQELIAAHPGDDGLREDLIELEVGEGMLDEAVASAKELADKTADVYRKALRRMRVAGILAQAGRKNEAVAQYQDVFAVSAEDSWLEREVLARVNTLFSGEGDAAALKGFYKTMRDTYPRRVGVKLEMARCLMVAGAGNEAVAMVHEVLKVLPGDRNACAALIALLEKAGRFKEAHDEVTALLATAGKDAALWEKLADLRRAMGDASGCKQALAKAVTLVSEGEAGSVAAAAIYQRYGWPEDAERTLREAVKTHGGAGDAGDALAVLLASGGKADEAVVLWREMAKTADREDLLRIARSLRANGRAADAYGILKERGADSAADPVMLGALCQAAQSAEQAEAVIPQALALLDQAKTTADLVSALRQTLALILRGKAPRKWLDQLAARTDPSTQELCLLAELLEASGDRIETDRILTKAIAGGEPLLAAEWRVRVLEMRGDFTAAIAATREWLAMPGGIHTEPLKRLVQLCERSGDIGMAIKETQNWQRLAPGDKMAWTKRAELFLTDRKPAEAVAELRRALARFGNDEELRATLAGTMWDAGLAMKAWCMYGDLYAEAQSPVVKLKCAGQLARLAVSEGREDELVDDFKRRARDNPSAVGPLLALAEIFREWLRPDDEGRFITEALRRTPGDVALLQRLADLQEQAGNTRKSAATLQSVLLVQDAPDNRLRLAAFRLRSGDAGNGLAELLDARGAANPRAIEPLVMPLAQRKEWENVVRILAGAVPRHPGDWRLEYLYAHALCEAGRKDDAFNRFAALLDATGDLPGVKPLIWTHRPRPGLSPNGYDSNFCWFAYLRQFMDPSSTIRKRDSGYATSAVPLPGSPAEACWMALCQALAIADENPPTRTARLAVLTSGTIVNLDFIKTVYNLKPMELRARLLAENAEPRLFRWYYETWSYQSDIYQNYEYDHKVMRKGVDVCFKADPDIALTLMWWLPLEGDNGLGADGIRHMLELIPTIDSGQQVLFIDRLERIAFLTNPPFPKDLRDRAEAILRAVFTEINLKAANRKATNLWRNYSLAVLWMRAGRFDEAVAWLNEVHEATRRPGWQPEPGIRYESAGDRLRRVSRTPSELEFPQMLASFVPYDELLPAFSAPDQGRAAIDSRPGKTPRSAR